MYKMTEEHKKKISDAKKGMIFSKEHRKKLSKSKMGEKNPNFYGMSDETKKKMSEARSGVGNHFYGKKHSEETKKKMRLSVIKRIEDRHGTIFPNYNINAISIIEQKANELGIDDLQHAENGGEFRIKKLGYWVDGYSKEKNVVIEYYEPFHKNQVERDERRKQEIIKHLDCEFIEIRA